MAGSRNAPVWPILGCLSLLLYGAFLVRVALIPFLLSFALAYLVNPVVNLFEARGLRRDHTVLGLYLMIALGISIAANYLLPSVTAELSLLQSQAPMYFRRTQEYFGGLQAEFVQRLPFGHAIAQHWSLRMYEPLVGHVQKVPGYILGMVPLLSLLFLVPFITFFMLMDSSRSIQQAIQVCPSRYVEQALHLVCEIDTSLGNYLRGVLIVALAIALASFAGLTVMGVDYALAIASLSGIVSFVPYAGAVLGAVVGAAVALFQFKSALTAAKVVALFTGIRLADEALLQPIVSKHSVHLHPLVYLLALMVGGQAFGFVGLLFAVPAACVLKVLVQLLWDWYVTEAGATLPSLPEARVPYT